MLDILLVDDDDDTRFLVGELLLGAGARVRVARDGVEALRRIDERFPTIVVSDVEMPELDGPAMVYRLFIENLGRENIPLILVSGNTNLPGIAQACGTPYYLGKPFEFPALIEMIQRAVAEARPPRPPGATR